MIVGWEWMWQRTKRLANLLLHPHILQAAIDLAEGLDRYCEVNELDEKSVLIGDAVFTKGLCYIEYPLTLEG